MIDDLQFNDWFSKAFRGEGTTSERAMCRHTWLEATRRADKRAREECAEICEKDFNLFSAAVIRATIPEE